MALPTAGLAPEEIDLVSQAVETFATALGGRQVLTDTLAIAATSPEVARVYTLLDDARYRGRSLRWICETAGLTVADLFKAFRQALLVKAHLEATRKIVADLPGVVEDVMQRARPMIATCRACRGTGTITAEPSPAVPNPEPRRCDPCEGTGKVITYPDLDRQKVALELGQLLSKGGGITLQQNTLVAPAAPIAAGSGPGSFEALQAAVRSVLHPPRSIAPIVEGTVTTEDPVP